MIFLVLLALILALGFSHLVFLQRVHAAQKAIADEVASLRAHIETR